MKKKRIDSLLEDWKGIMSSDGEDKLTRLMVIGKVFDNNCMLFDLINKQINLLETYHKHFDGFVDIDGTLNSLDEMLKTVGITGNAFDDEWDDEVGGKS